MSKPPSDNPRNASISRTRFLRGCRFPTDSTYGRAGSSPRATISLRAASGSIALAAGPAALGMHTTRSAATPKCSIICARHVSETVTTRAARRIDQGTTRDRTPTSRPQMVRVKPRQLAGVEHLDLEIRRQRRETIEQADNVRFVPGLVTPDHV